MYDAASILALIEPRLRELGISQKELGRRAFGKADNSAFQALRRGSVPSVDRMAAMAAVLGLECYLGAPRAAASPAALGNGATELLPEGYTTFAWHRACARPGLPPFALSQLWSLAHGLLPDQHVAVIAGPLKDSASDLHQVALVDPHPDPRDGWWATLDDGTVRLERISFVGLKAILPATADRPRARIVSGIDPSVLLGRALWRGDILEGRHPPS